MPLLEFREEGIYCSRAGVHIDPWKPVRRALITHGHADHARPGHGAYLATRSAAPVIGHRLGPISIETVEFGQQVNIAGVRFSFHPAGHIPGSAQIRVEYKGEVWVVSGDFKTEADGLSEPWEPVRCDVLITESTFGLPVYRWKAQHDVVAEISAWWMDNRERGLVSVLGAYALGKAQRILRSLDHALGPLFTHGAVEETNRVLGGQGLALPQTRRVEDGLKRDDYLGGLVLAPPSALGSPWMKRFGSCSTAFASGWMALRGARRRRGADRGFVLSDHADWDGLNLAVRESGAGTVFVTHGYTEIYARWLGEQGLNAAVVRTEFEGETLEEQSGNLPDRENGDPQDLEGGDPPDRENGDPLDQEPEQKDEA